mgnify:CR=1 FL=1|tara:strand:- start:14212 stop:14403 length:192 start_codon:yes stop_codon:yes gene_type:complete
MITTHQVAQDELLAIYGYAEEIAILFECACRADTREQFLDDLDDTIEAMATLKAKITEIKNRA